MSMFSSTQVLIVSILCILWVGSMLCSSLISRLLFSVGSCAHGGLQKVSRPIVLKLNWRGLSYKVGAWGRDSAPNPVSGLYWVSPLRADGR